MIEKIVEVGNLFEFYGNLLSEKQYKVVELFYIDDLSLGEIGELLNITRQGVYDNLKRAEDNLYEFENKLKLYEKFKSGTKNLKKINELANNTINCTNNKVIIDDMEEILKIVQSILKESWEVEK